jgi:thiol-disulfide isomerase/thioredoxin
MQRKWTYSLGFLVLLILAFYLYKKYKVAPDLTLQKLPLADLQNNTVEIATNEGEKILLCFGASWCGPCRQELKLVAEVQQTVLKDVRVIYISDEDLAKVQAFRDYTGYNFEWMKLQRPFHEIGINSIPTSYLINTKGQVVKKTVGLIDWEDPSTARHLLKLME